MGVSETANHLVRTQSPAAVHKPHAQGNPTRSMPFIASSNQVLAAVWKCDCSSTAWIRMAQECGFLPRDVVRWWK